MLLLHCKIEVRRKDQTMKIKTRFFAITVKADRLYVRIGSKEHGVEGKIARIGSYARFNWGVASWTLA